jgi:trk system potassium uptake protein TrkA
MLDAEGHDVTIMDVNAQSFARLDPEFRGAAVLGDGTEEESLRKAGVEEVDAFVATTEGDNYNIMAAQLAKRLFSVSKVVCRVYDPPRGELFQTLGLEVISPTTIVAQLLKEKVEG